MRPHASLTALALALASLGVVACDATDDDAPDAAAIDLTGVYTCTIEVVDGEVGCGGPVYLSDLSGAALPLSLTQVGQTLQAGIWGVVFDGDVGGDGRVSLSYRDTDCSVCSSTRPVVIDLVGAAGARQIHDITIRMYQVGVLYCEKTYRGTCAAN